MYLATTTADETRETEERDRAWGWDDASLNRSTSDIVPCVVHDCACCSIGAD